MATSNANLTLDYYKVKVFLYKYTPEFIRTPDKDTREGTGNQRIETYEVELDESKYFSKYDLSEYVSSYQFNQTINESTYDWTVTLHDPILTFDQINKIVKVEGGSETDWDATSSRLLAQYEATTSFDTRLNADEAPPTLNEAASIILGGKLKRGAQSQSFDSKISPASAQLTRIDSSLLTPKGLRLSDLVQPYDVMAVFLYKSKTPLEDLRVITKIDPNSGLQTVSLDEGGLFPLTKKQLQTESILLSRTSTVDNVQTTLFSTEFVGFVLDKSWSTTLGEVDTVTIGGNGVTRLFGSTRRIIKSSLFQDSIFKFNEISGAEKQISVLNNTFNGLKLHQIFQQLFNDCYRINFDADHTSQTSLFGLSTVSSEDFPVGSFYDISSLKVHNLTQTNLFSIPPFLLSLALKRHGYKYRDVKTNDSLQTIADKAKTVKPVIMISSATYENDEVVATGEVVASVPKPIEIQSSIDTALTQSAGLQIRKGSLDPLYFSKELDTFRPYFKFIEKVFENYNPALSTPYEIIEELKQKTFLEFIDHPSGYALVRAPQYNASKDVIYSSSLDITGVSYNSVSAPLIARQTVKYAADYLPQLPTQDFLAYTDGKLLLQFGQLEAAADANPNYRTEKEDSDTQSLETNRKSGIIRYAQYLQKLHNAALSTGTINCGYDQRIIVGQTFFDEAHGKFGYITSVTKSVSTGGAATMSFILSYVRDAYKKFDTLQFQELPTMLTLAQGFTGETLDTPETDKEQLKGLGTE